MNLSRSLLTIIPLLALVGVADPSFAQGKKKDKAAEAKDDTKKPKRPGDQKAADDKKAAEDKKGDKKATDDKKSDKKADDKKADDKKADDKKADDKKADDKKADEPKSEEKKDGEEPKAEEKKPEESKGEGVKLSLDSFKRKTTGGPPTIEAPFSVEPVRFMTVPGEGVYAQMADHTVRTLADRKRVLEADAEEGWSIGQMICAAGAKEKVVCLYKAIRSQNSNSQSGGGGAKKLVLIETGGNKKTVETASGKEDVTALGIHINAEGKLTYAYSLLMERTDGSVVGKSFIVDDGKSEELEIGSPSFMAKMAEVGGGDRHDAPVEFIDFRDRVYMVYRDGDAVTVKPPKGDPVKVADKSLHDIRPLVAGDGWFYIFYHDASTHSAQVAVTNDGKTWKKTPLDTKESGWQMEAAVKGDDVYAVYYYFRNTYNKGLRVVHMKNAEIVDQPFTILRERDYNTGWHPVFAINHDGTTWLTYWHEVEKKRRVWCKFGGPEELKQHEIGSSGGWEEGYKDWYLQTGVGGWYTWWVLKDGAPSASETSNFNGGAIGKTSYNVNAALLASANIEARYGTINIGASYAQSIVDDAAKSVGGNSGILSGSVKVDDLMLGHDLKLAIVWGRYSGRAIAGANVIADPNATNHYPLVDGKEAMDIKTNYIDAQVLLLNKWRIKYGLSYSQFNMPMGLHAWSARANQTQYTYAGSFFRDTKIQNIDVILGYSKLDYAAKYENRFADLFLDGNIAGGLSLLKFDKATVEYNPGTPDDGVKDVTSAMTYNIRGGAQAGFLFLNRWESLKGFGFYLRPAYTAEVTFMGSAGKPGDRKSDQAKSDTAVVTGSLVSLRHGPWFDAGLVW